MHEAIYFNNATLQERTNGNHDYEETEVTEFDIRKTCRICLNNQEENNLSSLYNVTEYFPSFSISTIIKECFGITLHEDVNLPSCICSQCILHTFEAFSFKKTILNTEEILNPQISNIELISDYIKEEENEKISQSLVSVENCYTNKTKINKSNVLTIASDHNYSKEATPIIQDDSPFVPHVLLNDSITQTQLEIKGDLSDEEMDFDERVNQDEAKLELDHSDGESIAVLESSSTNDEEKKYSIKPLSRNVEKWWLKSLGPPYECKICGRKYGAIYRAFYMHIRTHFVNKYPCRYCGKKFVYDKLIHHMRTHTNERPYACELCPARFTLQGNLKRHLLLHTGEKPYVCDICDKGFNQKSSMQQHREIHTTTTQVVCEFCGKIFVTKGAYRSHKFTSHKGQDNNSGASGDEEYKCIQCNIGFSKSQSLTRHSRIHDDSENITCGICKAVFHVYFSYNVHMFLHELQQSTSKTQSFDCKFCFDTFNNKEEFELHLLDHIAKPFECKHCNKYFASKLKLNRHLRQHSEDRLYNCQNCNKSFKSLTTLRQHTKIHTGRKPYLCQICLRSFTQQQQLSSHMLTHTGEKKYVCQYCGKAFALNGNLTVHIRRHTGDTPFHCDICGKGFHDSSSRKKHMIWKHKTKNSRSEKCIA